MNINEKYFTVGELADMYKISKQTLIYYDKIGLLKPEYVSENGYRYYYIMQYLDLEIILNLRRLEIPIIDIKAYLDNRSVNNLMKLLDSRACKCTEEISRLMKEHDRLQSMKARLPKMDNIIVDQIMLQYIPERKLFLTKIEENMSNKQRVEIFAQHSFDCQKNDDFRENHIGWILDKVTFFQGKETGKSRAYYSLVPGSEQQNSLIRPGGLCIYLAFRGIYYRRAKELAKKIKIFLERNELEACDDVYIMPLQNHWYDTDIDNYITQLIIPVINNQQDK